MSPRRSLRLLSAAAPDRLSTRSGTVHPSATSSASSTAPSTPDHGLVSCHSVRRLEVRVFPCAPPPLTSGSPPFQVYHRKLVSSLIPSAAPGYGHQHRQLALANPMDCGVLCGFLSPTTGRGRLSRGPGLRPMGQRVRRLGPVCVQRSSTAAVRRGWAGRRPRWSPAGQEFPKITTTPCSPEVSRGCLQQGDCRRRLVWTRCGWSGQSGSP